ncbi:hypothetical protein [Candidatus Albibeggiatoa sp. nov. NOAA]|uniref:hypothetical protein n=1 Tax=Candidatus Albibeggiatoa sp. nov. NOAA TaxID=3162724 RepID=UPI0032F4A163|nr:hypothetical protein [Thiotrichaceae bacterium]
MTESLIDISIRGIDIELDGDIVRLLDHKAVNSLVRTNSGLDITVGGTEITVPNEQISIDGIGRIVFVNEEIANAIKQERAKDTFNPPIFMRRCGNSACGGGYK